MQTFSTQHIIDWVTEKMPEFLTDLSEICSIRSVAETKNPSIPPFGQGCLDVLKKMFSLAEKYQMYTHDFDSYVVSISLEPDSKPAIGIWAHLDVVDEGSLSNWMYPPYELTIKDGYAIARGANDNKSSAIVGLYLLRYLKEHNITLKHPVHLYAGTCEEQGMYDLDYFTAHYPCPDLSLVPDSGFPVCCGERGSFNGELHSINKVDDAILSFSANSGLYMLPDRATIVLRTSPHLKEACLVLQKNNIEDVSFMISEEQISITCTGISSIAAFPQNGKNALDTLVRILCEYQLLSDETCASLRLCNALCEDYHGTALGVHTKDELSGSNIFSVTQCRLEDQHLVFSFISKYPVTTNDFPYQKTIESYAKQYGFDLIVTRNAPANSFPPDDPAVKVMTDTYNEIMNDQAIPFVMSGGTYARKLPHAFACGTGMPLPPAPEGLFLPGHGDYHQPDEAISIERMKKALIIYIIGILRLDSVL